LGDVASDRWFLGDHQSHKAISMLWEGKG
jgi:hypothetical protein